MSYTTPTYSFLPWLRQGIANKIVSDASSNARATIPVKLKITGKALDGSDLEHEINRNIALYGPGDIIGIDKKTIVKNEPRNWITNFESNYMPYIEFYDEDFPWRYSPTSPFLSDNRLMPWLALVVLKEDEFQNGKNVKDRPLAFIDVTDASSCFQPYQELWAWAHVHVNESVIEGEDNITTNSQADIDNAIQNFKNVLNKNPDLAYSRIMCPRKLEPNTSYHAFLIPSFESGRLAGLGLDPSQTPVDRAAWEDYGSRANNDGTLYPYYHQWFFKTGSLGDFEYLVRLLEPKPIDYRVGTRDMDVQEPGVNVSGINNPELDGVLKLGGALRIPLAAMSQKDQKIFKEYDTWYQRPYPHPFKKDLTSFINLADEYQHNSVKQANEKTEIGLDDDKDPIITAPLYGRWHALVQRLQKEGGRRVLPNTKNWVHELNLDPRFRVSAGFGTGVIQKNQENYMTAAWKQVGDILEANRKIRIAQLAKESSWTWYDKHLRPMFTNNPEKAFSFSAPVQARILANNLTVHHTVKESKAPLVLTSTSMRRITRPGSRLMKNLPFDDTITKDNLIERINNGEILPAPPKEVPEKLPTLQDLADNDTFNETNIKPEFVNTFKKCSNFTITPVDSDFKPNYGKEDSAEGKRFKDALRDAFDLINVSKELGKVNEKPALDLSSLVNTIFDAINPEITIPRLIYNTVFIPPRIKKQLSERFIEAMVYPEIDIPMYEPLKKISSELFLPNINFIANNSISLLETNQKFIEAYMVGLNHEFARELLWREYPTDQRGSYFRQFWDVSSYLPEPESELSPEELKEKLRDIPPLHRWSKASELGDHDNREQNGDNEEEVVLVIRGELLKKYPSAVIYAHKAKWHENEDGTFDFNVERELADLDQTENNPPKTKVKTPLYEAKVDPDINFFGFDLTTEEAQGGTGDNPGDENKPGWFFIIKERPGEPRFGLDLEPADDEPIDVWNDLSWSKVAKDDIFLQINNDTKTISIEDFDPTNEQEKADQNPEDKKIEWSSDMNAAELAYVLYQVPVMIAVHAAEMLPKP
ncbi:hypothetical protein [Galbibacter sp. BG1]